MATNIVSTPLLPTNVAQEHNTIGTHFIIAEMARCAPSRPVICPSAEVPGVRGQPQTATQHLSHKCSQIAAPRAHRVRCSPQWAKEGAAYYKCTCRCGARRGRHQRVRAIAGAAPVFACSCWRGQAPQRRALLQNITKCPRSCVKAARARQHRIREGRAEQDRPANRKRTRADPADWPRPCTAPPPPCTPPAPAPPS